MTGMQDKSVGSFMEFGMTPGNVRIRRFQLNADARDFAVGDIHGHFVRLEVALAAVKFSPEKDRLFSVGDLVDRGPESVDVLIGMQRMWNMC